MTKCIHGLSTSPSCKDPDNICLTCISPTGNSKMTKEEKREKQLAKLRKRYENYNNFNRDAGLVAKQFVIIKRCRECTGPAIDGYCCTICGSDYP